jgi:hypothetical protein
MHTMSSAWNNGLTILERIRQNHALEHATVHTLAQLQHGLRLVGRSDWTGFWLYGDVDTESVTLAAQEGLRRLRLGEAQMAIHPRCGTNIVSTLLLGAATGYLATRLFRSPLLRVTGLAAALLVTITYGQPLGLFLQKRVTTHADLGSLRLARIERQTSGEMPVHHIVTTG